MNDVGDAANTNNTQQTEIAIGDTAISRIEEIHTETLDMSRTSKVEQQLNINISQTPFDSFAMSLFSLSLSLFTVSRPCTLAYRCMRARGKVLLAHLVTIICIQNVAAGHMSEQRTQVDAKL